MKVLIVVAYAGSEKLVRMTERMLASVSDRLYDLEARSSRANGMVRFMRGVDFGTVLVNNAADRQVMTKVNWHAFNQENEGFGRAVNLAIRREIYDMEKAGQPTNYTHVLVLNNDLEFPDEQWLVELLVEADGSRVVSPCTDVTATTVAVASAARNLDPTLAPQVSAFCWLVPVGIITQIRRKFGFELFCPEFTNYGSDDVTGAILRKLVGPKPFKVVPRSWVRHKKAQTANELGVKAGTKELLQRIANWKRAKRLA